MASAKKKIGVGKGLMEIVSKQVDNVISYIGSGENNTLGKIIEGTLKAYVFTSEASKKLSESRLKICHGCPDLKVNDAVKDGYGKLYCGKCGCDLLSKTSSEGSKCPAGKW